MIATFLRDIEASIRFLSRLPVRKDSEETLPDFKQTAHTFPLAGLVIAIPSAFVLWIGSALDLPPLISATLSVITMVFVTGGLHEDGLADVADGFWGGHTAKRKLEIMRDSAIGTYGTLALVLAIILRIALYGEIVMRVGGFWAGLIVLASAALSRFAILQPWVALPPARKSFNMDDDKNEKPPEGLSVACGAADVTTLTRGGIAVLPAILILFISLDGWSLIAALIVFEFVVLAFVRLCRRHIGGHTGDTLGATQQLSELGLLLGLIWAM